jgi:hypothetical protein
MEHTVVGRLTLRLTGHWMGEEDAHRLAWLVAKGLADDRPLAASDAMRIDEIRAEITASGGVAELSRAAIEALRTELRQRT